MWSSAAAAHLYEATGGGLHQPDPTPMSMALRMSPSVRCLSDAAQLVAATGLHAPCDG